MGQISPDGHWQWDGWRWVPARPMPPPRNAPRVPTIWTRRLQILLLVVAAWGVVSAIITAARLPGEWSQMVQAIVAQWQAEGIPPSEVAVLRTYLAAVLPIEIAVIIVWSLGIAALQVVGTLRRWVWWYWVQFAICCLAALSLVVTLLDLIILVAVQAGTAPAGLSIYRVGAGGIPLTLAGDLLTVAAGVCMLIAAIRIGPWAMTRQQVLRP